MVVSDAIEQTLARQEGRMSPEERAREIAARYVSHSGMREQCEDEIEQAIRAAVAEEREARLREALQMPTEAMWGGLARDLIMWHDMTQPWERTPRELFKHLERAGREIPQWLRDEPEMQALDHVPSKGTRAVLIWRAMAEAAALTPNGAALAAAIEAWLTADERERKARGTISDDEAHDSALQALDAAGDALRAAWRGA